jgi:hypothetical protein
VVDHFVVEIHSNRRYFFFSATTAQQLYLLRRLQAISARVVRRRQLPDRSPRRVAVITTGAPFMMRTLRRCAKDDGILVVAPHFLQHPRFVDSSSLATRTVQCVGA